MSNLPFVEEILADLRRFKECVEDGQDVDLGRDRFDLLTQLGLLERTQRSPALWVMTQAGEDAIAQPAAGESVGKIVAFGESLHEVSWHKGKLPPLGTELFANAPPASTHGAGLHFGTTEDLALAIRQVSAYEDLGPELIAEEMFKQAGAPTAHGDELVAVVGTVPDGSGFKSLDFKLALESLPDGTRLYAMRAQAGEGGA